MVDIDPDLEWVNDRMKRFVQSDGSATSSEKILLEGMTDDEKRAFCLGVRAGKHSAAVEVVRGIRSPIGDEIARKIDPFMELE